MDPASQRERWLLGAAGPDSVSVHCVPDHDAVGRSGRDQLNEDTAATCRSQLSDQGLPRTRLGARVIEVAAVGRHLEDSLSFTAGPDQSRSTPLELLPAAQQGSTCSKLLAAAQPNQPIQPSLSHERAPVDDVDPGGSSSSTHRRDCGNPDSDETGITASGPSSQPLSCASSGSNSCSCSSSEANVGSPVAPELSFLRPSILAPHAPALSQQGLLGCPASPSSQQPPAAAAGAGGWQRRFHLQGWISPLQIPNTSSPVWSEPSFEGSGTCTPRTPLSVQQSGPSQPPVAASAAGPGTGLSATPGHLPSPALLTLSPRALQLDDMDLDIMDGVADMHPSDVVPRPGCHLVGREHDLRRTAIFNQTSSRLSPRPPSRLSQSRPGPIFISDALPGGAGPGSQPSSPPPPALVQLQPPPGQAGAVLQTSPLPPPVPSIRGSPGLRSPASPMAPPSTGAADGGHYQALPLPLFCGRPGLTSLSSVSTPASPAAGGGAAGGTGLSGAASASSTPRYGPHGASPLSPQRGLHTVPPSPVNMARPRSQTGLHAGVPLEPHPSHARRVQAEWVNHNFMMLMPSHLRAVADLAAMSPGEGQQPRGAPPAGVHSPWVVVESALGALEHQSPRLGPVLPQEVQGTAPTIQVTDRADGAPAEGGVEAGALGSGPQGLGAAGSRFVPSLGSPSSLTIRGSIRLTPGWHCYGQGVRQEPAGQQLGAGATAARGDCHGVVEEVSSRQQQQELQGAQPGQQQLQGCQAGALSVDPAPLQDKGCSGGIGGVSGALADEQGPTAQGAGVTAGEAAQQAPASHPPSPACLERAPAARLGDSPLGQASPQARRERRAGQALVPAAAFSAEHWGGGLPGSPLGRSAGQVLQAGALLGSGRPDPGAAALLADSDFVEGLIRGLPGVEAGDSLVVALVEALGGNAAGGAAHARNAL